jgi:hypothetical protein
MSGSNPLVGNEQVKRLATYPKRWRRISASRRRAAPLRANRGPCSLSGPPPRPERATQRAHRVIEQMVSSSA